MENSPGVWESAPSACSVVICFACIGSINGLECEHRRKVCSVSGDVMLSRTGDATSICAITAQHSLPFALPYPHRHCVRKGDHWVHSRALLAGRKRHKVDETAGAGLTITACIRIYSRIPGMSHHKKTSRPHLSSRQQGNAFWLRAATIGRL